MKIAIHIRKGSFSDEWVKYCKENHIDFDIVNVYDSNIVNQLLGYDVLLWHHSHTNYRDKLFAKQLILALNNTNLIVFPDFNTCWHFDDKVGQKYLFEAVNAPLVPSYVFYDKETAFDWARNTSFPKVFKLRGGAGSSNVRLIKSLKQCNSVINQSFGKGFNATPYLSLAFDQFKLFLKGKAKFYDVAKYFGLYLFPKRYMSKMLPREKGYLYFQEFIPENTFDTRVIVIGNKAYGMHRKVRENDFRASGSSDFDYSPLSNDVLKIAFETSKKLNFQCIAFDFIYLPDSTPLLVEASFGFGTKGSSKCKGFWDDEFIFHECVISPMAWIMEELLEKENKKYATDKR